MAGLLNDIDWLIEAEVVDRLSVNEMVLNELKRWAASLGGEFRVADILGGLGSNYRLLAPLFPERQQWRMVEADPVVFGRADLRVSGGSQVEPVLLPELSVVAIAEEIRGAHLILLPARPKPMEPDVLNAVLEIAKQDGAAVWAGFQPTGFVAWEPGSEDDARVCDMAQHSVPDPARHLVDSLEDRGFRVLKGESDWVLSGESDWLWHSKIRALQRTFLQRTLAVARRRHPGEAGGLLGWANKRAVLIERKSLTIIIGQTDIFAIPEA